MSTVLRLAIVDPNDTTRDALKNVMLGMDIVWLEAECSRYEFFADVVGQTHPDIGVIAVDEDPDKALALIETVSQDCPDTSVLVVSSSTDGPLILRAMRAGAKEFVTQPIVVQDLVAALERLSAQKNGSKDGKSRSSRVIAVAGATGGVGSTSIAVNLGCALAQDEANSVVLVDLDLALGDADVFLDTIPDYTLLDVAQNISRLDFTLLKRSLTKHPSGLYLLPRPVQLQDVELITADNMHRVFGLLKASFSHMIIDLSKSYTQVDMAGLETANDVLLVSQLDLPCLRNVVRLMMSFGDVPGVKEKVKVIINRTGLGDGQISEKKAKETIGGEIFMNFPNDYRTMVEMRNNGVPLIDHAPRAAITQHIKILAEALCGSEESLGTSPLVGAANGGSGWLNFWPAKSKR